MPNCKGKKLLHFEKSDWNTTVWANRELLGTHVGGYDPFTFDLPASGGGDMELVVGVFDATDKGPAHDQVWYAYGTSMVSACIHAHC